MKHRLNCTRVRKSLRGFTLIELLVVIAIIALLLAILTPSLSLAKRYSKAVVCGANVRRIGTGLSLYAQEYNDWLPRALPLGAGATWKPALNWNIPWDSGTCPPTWQAGYPALLAPYLTDAIVTNPFDAFSLPNEMGEEYIELFRCPGNKIDRSRSDDTQRKCGYPLDYGLHNYASQNRLTDTRLKNGFLVADQTWGLAYVEDTDSSGLHEKQEDREALAGWWNAFPHPSETINVLFPNFSVERLSKEEFIKKFKTDTNIYPPIDDLL